jgi:hypothetical protein
LEIVKWMASVAQKATLAEIVRQRRSRLRAAGDELTLEADEVEDVADAVHVAVALVFASSGRRIEGAL